MENRKPILTLQEQIDYLKSRGVRFEIIVVVKRFYNTTT